MTHTPNYSLTQWDAADRILRDDFNADNAAVDTALGEHAAAIASLTSGKGNCQIEVRTYTGQSDQETGTHRLTFETRPALAYITDGSNILWLTGFNERPLFLGNYTSPTYRLVLFSPNFTWEGNTAVFTERSNILRMDQLGITYLMIMFFPAGEEVSSTEA